VGGKGVAGRWEVGKMGEGEKWEADFFSFRSSDSVGIIKVI